MQNITKDEYEKLKLTNKYDIKTFSLKDEILICKVVDVYDGDTCKVVFYLNNKLVKFNVRMMGYDSPEIKSKNEIEKKYSLISKKMLENLILNKIVKICCHEFDKYGRLLGTIIIHEKDRNELNVNNFMINNNFGYSYLGDKKKEFEELSEYYKNIELKNIETIDYNIIFNELEYTTELIKNNISDYNIDNISENDNKNIDGITNCRCIIC